MLGWIGHFESAQFGMLWSEAQVLEGHRRQVRIGLVRELLAWAHRLGE
jgi:hypothetical protein